MAACDCSFRTASHCVRVQEKTRMLLLKYLLLFTGAVLAGGALAILMQDIYRARRLWQLDLPDSAAVQPPLEIRWRGAGRLALMSIGPFLLGLTFVVVPSGHAGVL